MSSSDEEELGPSEGEEDKKKETVVEQDEEETGGSMSGYQPPISAIPPRVTLTEESQMEVSASPAFQCLDDVRYSSTSNCLYIIAIVGNMLL